MRTFVGVPLPLSFREWLQHFEISSKGLDLPIRIVPPETCHVTLCFLGDIQPLQVNILKARLEKVVTGHRVVDVTLDCLGFFGRKGCPSVLWAGCKQENRAMSGLAADTLGACRDTMKHNREHFFLHVTLARFVDEGSAVDTAMVSQAFPGAFSFPATHLVMFESVLGRGIPEYRTLFSIPLP